MLHKINKLNIKTIYILLFVMASFAITISVFFGFYNMYYSYNSQQEWIKYNNTILKKHNLLAELKSVLGYGGMINNFHNYILQQKEENFIFLADHIANTNLIIDQLSQLCLPQEKLLLNGIIQTIEEYESKVSVAMNMTRKKIPVEKIYKTIKIDDSAAINAFDAWDKLLKISSIKQQQNTTNWLKKDLILAYTTLPVSVSTLLIMLYLMFFTLKNKIMTPLNNMSNALDLIIAGKTQQIEITDNNDEFSACTKKLVQVLEYSKNILQHSKLLDNIPVGILIYKGDNLKIDYVNDTTKKIFLALHPYIKCDIDKINNYTADEIFPNEDINNIIKQIIKEDDTSQYNYSFDVGNKHISANLVVLSKEAFGQKILMVIRDISQHNKAKTKILQFIDKLIQFSSKLENSINKISRITGYIKHQSLSIEKSAGNNNAKLNDAYSNNRQSLIYSENTMQQIADSVQKSKQQQIDCMQVEKVLNNTISIYNQFINTISSIQQKSEDIYLMILNANLEAEKHSNQSKLEVLANQIKEVVEEVALNVDVGMQNQQKEVNQNIEQVIQQVKEAKTNLTAIDDINNAIANLTEQYNNCTIAAYNISKENKNNIKELYNKIADISESSTVAHSNVNQLLTTLEELSAYYSTFKELSNMISQL